MRRLLILFACLILLSQFAAAEIITNKQPDEIYSLGDIIPVPTTVKSIAEISGIFEMNLICNGLEINFYKNGVSLSAGEEKRLEPSLVLMRNVIGELKGTCKIKSILGEEFILTDEFKVSNSIDVYPDFEQSEFNPAENVLLEGSAVKENGKDVNGFIEMEILDGNNSILTHLETINNGFFSMNITFPGNIRAGAYLLRINAHEEDLGGETTNEGSGDTNIIIKQVPTSLEILFEDTEVEPGEDVSVKAILHDQTGEKITSASFITIKDNKDKIHDQIEMATDEFLDFPIPYNQQPAEWVVVAVSNKLTNEAKFTILEKEDVRVEIINKTVEITNTGNVLYNRTVLVKIGEASLNIDVFLDVDKSQKYILSAPDGEYEVEVIADEESISKEVILTGKSVDIRKASSRVGSLVRFPIVWIFIIAILGFIAFIVFKKGYKKSFIGYIESKIPKKNKSEKSLPLKKKSLVQTGGKAELSLSIKGDKQNVSLVALKIKNLQHLQSKEGSAEETIQKIINATEESKAAVYENHNELFFILCPTRTRTFKNERAALNLAKKIKGILEDHNKKFKETIEFGISLNYGTIIAKQERNVLKFMSMGTLMGTAKKVSSLAENEILLGEKMNEKMRSEVKTIKHKRGTTHVYAIKEIKDVEGNKKFVRSFMDRIEKK